MQSRYGESRRLAHTSGIHPGTDAALALVNAVIAKDLIERDYIEKYIFGVREATRSLSRGQAFRVRWSESSEIAQTMSDHAFIPPTLSTLNSRRPSTGVDAGWCGRRR
jgi:hypothetical protein